MKNIFIIAMMLCMIPIAYSLNASEATGLWRFEEGNGTLALDSSLNNNDGTIDTGIHEASKGTNGTGNFSLDFDGANTEVVVDDDDGLLYTFGNQTEDFAFSVGAWVFMDDATGFRVMTKRHSNTEIEWGFFTDSSDQLNFQIQDDINDDRQARRTAAITSLELEWHYFVATYDGAGSSAGMNIYIDGVVSDIADDNNGAYVAMQNENINLTIGTLNRNAVADGNIDEVFVIDRALSAVEITDLFNNGWFVDIVPPVVNECSIINPTLTCNGTATLRCNVTDDNIVLKVEFDYEDNTGFNRDQANNIIGTDFYFINRTYTHDTIGLTQNYNFTRVNVSDGESNLNITQLQLSYNYTCLLPDVDPPLLEFLGQINVSFIDKTLTNITTNISCTDNQNISTMSLIAFNSTDTIFSFLNESGDNPSFIVEDIDLSNVSVGIYNATVFCNDTVNLNDTQTFILNIVDTSPAIITLISPLNNSQIFQPENLLTDVPFIFNVDINATCNLVIDDVISQSEIGMLGNNTFLQGFDSNITIQWFVNCSNFVGINSESNQTRTFSFFVTASTAIQEVFDLNSCPIDTLPKTVFFIFMILLGLGLSIMAFAYNVPFIGIFGAFMLLFMSYFIGVCLAFAGVLMFFLAAMLLFYHALIQ